MFEKFKQWVIKFSLDFSESDFLSIKEAFNFFLENRTIEIDEINFSNLHDIEKKKRLGIAYTPEEVRFNIIETVFHQIEKQSLNSLNLQFCDPCCGSGTFAIDIARKLVSSQKISFAEAFENNIFFFDKDRISILLALANIYLFLNREGVDVSNIKINTAVRDFLKSTDFYDIYITNPPYVKFQNIENSERIYLKQKYKEVFSGSMGMSSLFIFNMLETLNPNGIIGIITQNNIFTSVSAEKLRNIIGNRLFRIDTYGSNHIFKGVSAYTCLMYITKQNQTEFIYMKDGYKSIIKNSSLNSHKWRMGSRSELSLLRRMEFSGVKLKELCDISVGIATLKDKAFTVFQNESKEWIASSPCGKQRSVESEIIKPLIKISDMENECDILNNKRGIIYPYRIQKGKIVLIEEEEFLSCYPIAYDALKMWEEELNKRSSAKKGGLWYQWGRSQSMYPIQKKLLTKTFNDGPNFLLDPTDSLFSNGYALKPKSVSLEFIQKILNSKFFEKYAKLTSFEIEGGYQCYQKNFIENFSVPEGLINMEEELIGMENIDDVIEDYY